MQEFTVSYTLTDDQVKRLEALLPHCRRVESFKNWTLLDVLQLIMEQGSTYAIDSKLDFIEKTLPGEKSETPAMEVAGETNITDK